MPLLSVDKNNPLTMHLYYLLGFAAVSEIKNHIFKQLVKALSDRG